MLRGHVFDEIINARGEFGGFQHGENHEEANLMKKEDHQEEMRNNNAKSRKNQNLALILS